MRRLSVIGAVLLWGVVAGGAADAACSCQCIDGVARTLCSSVDEARDNPAACRTAAGPIDCPPPDQLEPAPALYEGPAGAAHCRAARLWDPDSGGYAVSAKVCQLDVGETAG
jgi:hypothetical protein